MPLAVGGSASRGQPGLLQHVRSGVLDLHPSRRGARDLQDARDLLERVDHALATGPHLPLRADAARAGDLASYLMHATFEDRPLSENEILDMLTVLVLAGLDTTRGELGYMFKHLVTHPEHRRALIEDPTLAPGLVEEVLRYYTI